LGKRSENIPMTNLKKVSIEFLKYLGKTEKKSRNNDIRSSSTIGLQDKIDMVYSETLVGEEGKELRSSTGRMNTQPSHQSSLKVQKTVSVNQNYYTDDDEVNIMVTHPSMDLTISSIDNQEGFGK
jgi:hypothetical protein